MSQAEPSRRPSPEEAANQTPTREMDPPGRILMTTDAVGGVWRYSIDLARELARASVQTTLLGIGPRPSPAQIAELEGVGFAWDWLAMPLDWMPGGVEALPLQHAAIARAASDCGAQLLHLNALPQCAQSLREWPLVGFTHSCLPTWWSAVKGAPLPAEWRQHELANANGFNAADVVVAPSRAHADAVRSCYGENRTVHAIHNSAPQAPGAERREPFVFAAARWWDEAKNASTLDEAARAVPWPVVMAGATRGPDGQQATIKNACATGTMDTSETRGHMRRAAIFAAPSVYEPFGLSVLEAATSSAALVLSDIPTFRELWDGAALFAPPREPDAWAHVIARLIADEALRRRLGERATKRAQRYSRQSQTAAMLQTYGRALRLKHATHACAPPHISTSLQMAS